MCDKYCSLQEYFSCVEYGWLPPPSFVLVRRQTETSDLGGIYIDMLLGREANLCMICLRWFAVIRGFSMAPGKYCRIANTSWYKKGGNETRDSVTAALNLSDS